MTGRPIRLPALTLLLAALASTTGCARVLYNFGTVEPGRIYRSAQPSPLFLRWLDERRDVRTIINLRGDTDGYESAFAARHGIRLFVFDLSASRPPSRADVERFLDIVRDPEHHPVLVHCRNGVDRTGYMIGLLRVRAHEWTIDRATREMNRFWQFEWFNGVPQGVVKGDVPLADAE